MNETSRAKPPGSQRPRDEDDGERERHAEYSVVVGRLVELRGYRPAQRRQPEIERRQRIAVDREHALVELRALEIPTGRLAAEQAEEEREHRIAGPCPGPQIPRRRE